MNRDREPTWPEGRSTQIPLILQALARSLPPWSVVSRVGWPVVWSKVGTDKWTRWDVRTNATDSTETDASVGQQLANGAKVLRHGLEG